MSARKASSLTSQLLQDGVTIQGREACLALDGESVLIRRGGMEFRSPAPFPAWTEMTVTLRTRENGAVRCSGVVISSSGSRHAGYLVSMVFTGMSRQAEARLAQMAQSSLA
jgi:hypothetical protein